MKNQKRQAGFTLIELMIVIAIIGILMAYAIPAYRDYTVRSKAGECNAISAAAKLGVSEYRINRGLWAGSNSDAQLRAAVSIAGANVLSVGVANDGVITCTYNTEDGTLDGDTLTWTPTDNDGSISWACAVSGGISSAQDPCP